MSLGSTSSSDTSWNSIRLGAHTSDETYSGSRFGAQLSSASYPPVPLPHEGQINTAIDMNSSTVPYCSLSSSYTLYNAKLKRAIVYGGAPSLVPANFATRGWWYADLAAIYNNNYPGFGSYVPGSTNQSAYILRYDSDNTTKCFMPYGAIVNNEFAQYAADPGNTSWRSFYKSNSVQAGITNGYSGTRMDDVNPGTQTYTSNGAGTHVAARDPRTSAAMTAANWNRYIAEQVEDIRASYPNQELLANMQWFSGNSGATRGYNNTYIQRIIAAVDVMEIERGINDAFHSNSDEYSWQACYEYVDYVHSVGTAVFWKTLATDHTSVEYQLATYFLLSSGADYVSGSMVNGNPATYWTAFDIDLGNASATRYVWNTLQRRDFDSGFVLVNPPGGATVTGLSLGGSYIDTSGATVTTVTLAASRGAVLRNP